MGLEAARVVALEVRVTDVVSEFAVVLAVEAGVVDVFPEAPDVLILEPRAVEMVSEPAAVLVLEVDAIDWFPEFTVSLNPDVEETNAIVEVLEVYKTEAALVDLAPVLIGVLAEGDLLALGLLTTGT